MSSRTSLRKALGLERLPAKLSKPQATPTLQLWVLYQQHKIAASSSQTGSSNLTAREATADTQHGKQEAKAFKSVGTASHSSNAQRAMAELRIVLDATAHGICNSKGHVAVSQAAQEAAVRAGRSATVKSDQVPILATC